LISSTSQSCRQCHEDEQNEPPNWLQWSHTLLFGKLAEFIVFHIGGLEILHPERFDIVFKNAHAVSVTACKFSTEALDFSPGSEKTSTKVDSHAWVVDERKLEYLRPIWLMKFH
jgi:hypothetical protein